MLNKKILSALTAMLKLGFIAGFAMGFIAACDSNSEKQTAISSETTANKYQTQIALCKRIANFYTDLDTISAESLADSDASLTIQLELKIKAVLGMQDGMVSCVFDISGLSSPSTTSTSNSASIPSEIVIGNKKYTQADDIADLLKFKTLEEHEAEMEHHNH